MYCFKCKYTSFDHFSKCPKCGRDWSEDKKKINSDWIGYNENPWLQAESNAFQFEQNQESPLISGFEEEDMEFSFEGEKSEEAAGSEEKGEEKSVSDTPEDNLIDYFQEEDSDGEEPILEFDTEDIKHEESNGKTEVDSGEEIDISELEWEEEDLDSSAETNTEFEKHTSETGDESLDLEGSESLEETEAASTQKDTEGEEARTDKKPETQKTEGIDDLESLDLDWEAEDGEQNIESGKKDTSSSGENSVSHSEEEILVDLSMEDIDEDIFEEAENKEKETTSPQQTKTNGDRGENNGEMDGDIDYPELDLLEEEK